MKIEETFDENENKIEETPSNKEFKGLVPNKDNGHDFENYRWTQDAHGLSLYIPISEDVKSKDISLDLHPDEISIKVKGNVVFEGKLFSLIKVENCTWFINNFEKRELVVELDKKKFDEWWAKTVSHETEIDLSLVRPPNANISDLDQETRATINKMMFEQQEKEKQGFYKDLHA